MTTWLFRQRGAVRSWLVASLVAGVLHGASGRASAEPEPPLSPQPPLPAPSAPAPAEPPVSPEPPAPAEQRPANPPAEAPPPKPAGEPGPQKPAPPSPSPGAAKPPVAAAGAAEAKPPAAKPEEPGRSAWYDRIEVGAFVDVYGSLNFDFPRPQGTPALLRGPDQNAGFSLSWAGVDIAYPPSPVGAAVSLRAGPTALLYAGTDADQDLSFLKQAYVTWQPTPKLGLCFGKMDAPFGVEPAESHLDYNYTRGLVHWLAQPGFFTGLRAAYEFSDRFDALVFVANGWDETIDDNLGKTLGAQVGLVPVKSLEVRLGVVAGPEQPELAPTRGAPALDTDASGRWRILGDLSVWFDPIERLGFQLNGNVAVDEVVVDAGTLETSTVLWYGIAGLARFAFTKELAAAVRVEHFGDPEGQRTGIPDEKGGYRPVNLLSLTGTLQATPWPSFDVKLDGRLDWADDAVFPKSTKTLTPYQPTLTLGVVVKTE